VPPASAGVTNVLICQQCADLIYPQQESRLTEIQSEMIVRQFVTIKAKIPSSFSHLFMPNFIRRFVLIIQSGGCKRRSQSITGESKHMPGFMELRKNFVPYELLFWLGGADSGTFPSPRFDQLSLSIKPLIHYLSIRVNMLYIPTHLLIRHSKYSLLRCLQGVLSLLFLNRHCR
jgi:hypothetical protein